MSYKYFHSILSFYLFSFVFCAVASFKPNFLDVGYVDLLEENVVKKFIEVTHDEYYKRLPEYFGNVIKAIITDEPGLYCNLKI